MTSDIQTRMGYRVRTPRRLSGWHVGNDVGLPLEGERGERWERFAPSDWGKKDLRLQASLRRMRRMCLVTDMYSNRQEQNSGRGGVGKKERVGDKQNTCAKGRSQVADKGSPTACKWNQDCCSTVVGLSFLRFTTASHSAGKVFHRGLSSVRKKKQFCLGEKTVPAES